MTTAVSPTILQGLKSSSDDPFLSPAANHAVRPYFAPSTPSPSLASNSFGQYRLNNGHPISIAIPSTPSSVPAKRPSSVGGLPPSPAPFVGYANSTGAFIWPTTTAPSTPSITPLSLHAFPVKPMSPISPTFAPSLDVEMADAYTTPPAARILPTTSSLHLSVDPPSSPFLTSYRSTAPKNVGPHGTLSPIKISLLATSEAPLTPPLTPPCPPFLALPPIEIQDVSPPSFPTLASRLLNNYLLHPLFDAQYKICDELGSGGFGFVVRAVRNVDGLGVAVKFIERAKIPSHGWVNSRSWGEAPGLWEAVNGVRTLPMEAYVLRSVRHEGVVAYVDLFEDAKYFYLVCWYFARSFRAWADGVFVRRSWSTMDRHGSRRRGARKPPSPVPPPSPPSPPSPPPPRSPSPAPTSLSPRQLSSDPHHQG